MTVPSPSRASLARRFRDFGLQLQTFEEIRQTVAGLGGDFEFQGLAAHGLDLDVMLQKLGTHPLRVRIGLVDLVDRHDERHAGRLRVADRLHRLGHDTVISRHHEHDDIRHLGATGAHGGERRVAGGVDEGDHVTGWRCDLIRADMLRDATGFAGDDGRFADGVEQRGLAVIDMAHDGHDGRTRIEILFEIRLVVEQALFDIGLSDAAYGVPSSSAMSWAESESITSVIL